ncbi:MAG: TldD/PmbA family protein [Acidimicrobiales bacterium]|nr:TldD/PmbA family protein [Acidimicrobiales bacterium]
MQEELLRVAENVVGWANENEQVEVVAVHGKETEIRVYQGEIESFTAAESHGIGIRVVYGGRQGMAYAGTLEEKALAETFAEARDNASFGTPDQFMSIAEPDGVEPVSLELLDPTLGSFANEEKISMALELEKSICAADKRIIGVESTEYVDSINASAIVTTTGIRRASYEGGCYLAASSLATDGTDTQTGFGYSVGRNPHQLNIQKASDDAAERATRLLGAKKAESGRRTVILDPYVTAQFLSIIGSTLSGEALLKGRSLFADRDGDQVAAGFLTMIDDPTDPDSFTATEVDGEGLASRRNVLIEEGTLTGFLHNSYTARALGTTSTGSAVRSYNSSPGVGPLALTLIPGERTQKQLIEEVGEGMLIQGIAGLHSGVNPVSGDFSAGAEGLMIRGGQLAEPIREVTIASTLQRMLLDIQNIGNDLERLPMRSAGVSIVVSDIMVSGA